MLLEDIFMTLFNAKSNVTYSVTLLSCVCVCDYYGKSRGRKMMPGFYLITVYARTRDTLAGYQTTNILLYRIPGA